MAKRTEKLKRYQIERCEPFMSKIIDSRTQKVMLQDLSFGNAKHYARVLNDAYKEGFNEARTLYDEKLFD